MSAQQSDRGRIPWARLLVEGGVVILSILLAFGIDAAWDQKQDRARESEYLKALHTEMLEAAAELAVDHGRRDEWLAYADSLLEQMSVRTAPDSAVNIWIQNTSMFMTRFFPPSAVLNELVSSGSLSSLSSNDLRFSLLAYQRAHERVNYLEDWAREVDEDGLRPYLTQHFRWTRVMPLPLVDSRLPDDPLEPVAVSAATLGQILSDPVFENLVLIRRQRLAILQRRSGHLGQIIADVIELLEEETS